MGTGAGRPATVDAVDPLIDTFRDAMARVPAPVTVITTAVDGAPTGTTVSAFASLSLTPPMVVFALDNRGGMIDRVRESGRLGVNILGAGQGDLAIRFARRDLPDRFAGLDWTVDHGLPRLDGIVSWLRCEELELLPGGDHTVVLAHVTAAETLGDHSLGYHLRTFRDVGPAVD